MHGYLPLKTQKICFLVIWLNCPSDVTIRSGLDLGMQSWRLKLGCVCISLPLASQIISWDDDSTRQWYKKKHKHVVTSVGEMPKNPNHEKLCGRGSYIQYNEHKLSRWSPASHTDKVTDTVSCCSVYIPYNHICGIDRWQNRERGLKMFKYYVPLLFWKLRQTRCEALCFII